MYIFLLYMLYGILLSSKVPKIRVVDRHRFYADQCPDPDPTFLFYADPNPDPGPDPDPIPRITLVKKSQNFVIFTAVPVNIVLLSFSAASKVS